MYLRRLTLLLLISFASAFLARTAGSIFPFLFADIRLVKLTMLVHLSFLFCQLLFWIAFYKEYASPKGRPLKTACTGAIAGSLAVTLLYLKELPRVFALGFSLPPFALEPYVNALAPLAASLFFLVFFLIFKSSTGPEEKRTLDQPIASMIAGVSLLIVGHILVAVNFFSQGRFQWPGQMSGAAIPVLLAAFLLILNFYYRFYLFLESGTEAA